MMEDDEPEGYSLLNKSIKPLELEDFPPDAPELEENKDDAMKTESPPAAVVEVVSDEHKRKRGKRKVLKKTTKRDEKGYLGKYILGRC
jgi:hypothetical protein